MYIAYSHCTLKCCRWINCKVLQCSPAPLSYSSANSSSPMSDWNKDALVSLKGQLKVHVLLDTGLADKLQTPAGGFMSAAEAQSVTALPNNHEQMGKLIDILQGKGNNEFRKFCEILRQANHVSWADTLERKAKEISDSMRKGMML